MTLQCEDNTTTISNIICENDFISFNVTASAGCTNDIYIANMTVSNFYAIVPAVFNVPSPGCLPINVTFSLSRTSSCNHFELESILIGPDTAPIPTVGLWGLIILSIFLSVLGVSIIKRKISQQETVI